MCDIKENVDDHLNEPIMEDSTSNTNWRTIDLAVQKYKVSTWQISCWKIYYKHITFVANMADKKLILKLKKIFFWETEHK